MRRAGFDHDHRVPPSFLKCPRDGSYFAVRRMLGRGGYGNVYHVTCIGTTPEHSFRNKVRPYERAMTSFEPILPQNPANNGHANPWSAVVKAIKSAACSIADFVTQPFRNSEHTVHGSSASRSVRMIQNRAEGKRSSAVKKKADVESRSIFRNGMHYALKVVSKSRLAKSTCGPDLVRNEVRLHSMLKHPGIVRMHAAWEDAYHIYMILDLMAGPTLEQLLCSRKRIAETEAASYTSQILETLSYLHSLNIIHKDVTLSNLILSGDKKRVRLFDFGLSEQMQEGSGSIQSTVCGTPSFVAPELLSQASEKVMYTAKVDTWSVGVIMYAMLTGRLPFNGNDIAHTFRLIRSARYTFPTEHGLNERAQMFICSILVEDPTLRPCAFKASQHPFLLPATKKEKRMRCRRTMTVSGRVRKRAVVHNRGNQAEQIDEQAQHRRH